MGRGRLLGAGLGLAALAAVLTCVVGASASLGPPLNVSKLKACLQLHGGLPDSGGLRSTGFSYGVDQDPQVGALIVVSGSNPRPSLSTGILTTGRKPVLVRRFSNVLIDVYVFHRNGVKPLPGAITAATKMVSTITAKCVASSRRASTTRSVNPPIVLVSAPAHTGWQIPSSSMEPTLHCAKPGVGCLGRSADWPVVSPIHGPPPRGDIVAFEVPVRAALKCGSGGVFIKRIIGLPGEEWSEKNGYVSINGKKLNEPYVAGANRDLRTIPSVTIPAGRYFVMGDNRSSSCDSRAWGTLPSANLIGEVTKVYREK